MPTANVAPDARIAICLWSFSCVPGMNSITSTPTIGRKVPRLSR